MTAPQRILFVSQTGRIARPYLDPSTRYRCFTPAAALRRKGYETSVMSQHMFERRLALADAYDVIVFHRPQLTEALSLFLEREKTKKLIVDFDDFIFDVSRAAETPAVKVRGASIATVSKYLAENAAAARYFSHFSVSTLPLGEEVSRVFKTSTPVVISNAIDPWYAGWAASIRQQMQARPRPYKFGYFSGTASHDLDLATVGLPIKRALDQFPGSRMLILGPVKIPAVLSPYVSRIDHWVDAVPFQRLPQIMAQVEVVIAPLEETTFTRCKSGLKFFEAALLGCSVVATPIPDIARFNSPMLRTCSSEDDWTRALVEPFNSINIDVEAEATSILAKVDSDIVAVTWQESFLK